MIEAVLAACLSQACLDSGYQRITEAIYWVEGGAQAKKPYGVLSVPCNTKQECRKIAFNTVRNNHRRWLRAGRPGEFLNFLADRYCPPSVDKQGNINWKRNIKSILQRSTHGRSR